MKKKYSQTKAMFSITIASLRSMVRSPASIVFSIAFPLIFILIFGLLDFSRNLHYKIGISENSDKQNPIYNEIKNNPTFEIVQLPDNEQLKLLEKGQLTAILKIESENIPKNQGDYSISITSSNVTQSQNIFILKTILNEIIQQVNKKMFSTNKNIAFIQPTITMVKGRKFKQIDFILPGQLGFSLLGAGIFGVAFVFYNLRSQMVLKRLYATPIHRRNIVLGEALSRVVFQMLTAIIIISVGYFCFDYTLVHGWITFFEMMFLSLIALLLFMGIGFIISSVSKNDASIPPLANLFMMPQFILSGTFFTTDAFPKWLQSVSNILPLTHFNIAMRKIAFDGSSLIDNYKELLILGGWLIVVYIVAFKTFRWE